MPLPAHHNAFLSSRAASEPTAEDTLELTSSLNRMATQQILPKTFFPPFVFYFIMFLLALP